MFSFAKPMSLNVISGRDPITGASLSVEVEAGRIVSIQPGPEGETAWISAGLIDLQVNGYAGYELNDSGLEPETVVALTAELHRLGVTTLVPTLITASEEELVARLTCIAQARTLDPQVAHSIPYVHVEGPSLSMEDGPRGAHPRAAVRAPDLLEFGRWQAASGGLVGMVTLSPHWDTAAAYTKALTAQGIHVCIGHTDASAEQITAAADAGAVLSTHLGNGSSELMQRHHNVLWTQLADDRLFASFIADGHHLPAAALKAMIRAKGVSRSILVSDVTGIGGLAPGTYQSPIGGSVTLAADGRLYLPGTTYLAGSATPLIRTIGKAMKLANLTLSEALQMATLNPGRFVGGLGVLREGASADLIRFDWNPEADNIALRDVWVNGRAIERSTAGNTSS
jgi:N-acetylglucosamine-6-phosphate deacetylase